MCPAQSNAASSLRCGFHIRSGRLMPSCRTQELSWMYARCPAHSCRSPSDRPAGHIASIPGSPCGCQILRPEQSPRPASAGPASATVYPRLRSLGRGLLWMLTTLAACHVTIPEPAPVSGSMAAEWQPRDCRRVGGPFLPAVLSIQRRKPTAGRHPVFHQRHRVLPHCRERGHSHGHPPLQRTPFSAGIAGSGYRLHPDRERFDLYPQHVRRRKDRLPAERSGKRVAAPFPGICLLDTVRGARVHQVTARKVHTSANRVRAPFPRVGLRGWPHARDGKCGPVCHCRLPRPGSPTLPQANAPDQVGHSSA